MTMILNYYALQSDPFSPTSHPAWFFASRSHTAALQTLLESLKVTKERPRYREYADIQEHARITAGKLTAGELTLDAALKEIDAGTNRILGK